MATGVIRSYGEFWSPDLVDWGRPGAGGHGQLLGHAWDKTVDVWDQLGVYVLLHDWQVVYVGRVDATKRSLGSRLREHKNGRLAGRWDRFSWYGIRAVNRTGELGKLGLRQTASQPTVVRTLESVLLAVTVPLLNKVSATIPGAMLIEQVAEERPRPVASYLAEIRSGVEKLNDGLRGFEGRLDRMEARSAASNHS